LSQRKILIKFQPFYKTQ